MKKFILTFGIALLSLSFIPQATATEDEPMTAEEKAEQAKQKKIAKMKFRWERSLRNALKTSKETGLPVIILFTAGNACGYCVRLENEILGKREFKDGMNGVAIGVRYPVPSPGAILGDKEAKKYGVNLVPDMIVVDSEGKKIGSTGYSKGRTVKSYLDYFKKLSPLKN